MYCFRISSDDLHEGLGIPVNDGPEGSVSVAMRCGKSYNTNGRKSAMPYTMKNRDGEHV